MRLLLHSLCDVIATFLHRKEEVNCLAIQTASIRKIKKVKTVYFDKYSPLLLFTGKKRSTFFAYKKVQWDPSGTEKRDVTHQVG